VFVHHVYSYISAEVGRCLWDMTCRQPPWFS
jgi:hypothetical protein